MGDGNTLYAGCLLIQNGSVSYIDESLNFFRKHSSNTTEKCYSNGTDFIEDKSIFDYLVKNSLIKSSTIKSIRQRNLIKFSTFPFDSEDVREKVIKAWDFSLKERIRRRATTLFYKLLSN